MSCIANLFDEEYLTVNMKAAAFFVLLYEHLEDVIIEAVKMKIANICVLDGTMYYSMDPKYIKKLKEKVNNHIESQGIPYEIRLRSAERDIKKYRSEIFPNQKDNEKKSDKEEHEGKTLKGSLNYLIRNMVFSEQEVDRILKTRIRRCTIVHELLNVLSQGLTEDDAKMIADMLVFSQRVNKWIFQQSDMPIMETEIPRSGPPDDVIDGDDAIIISIFRILFCNEGELFKGVLKEQIEKEGD